MAQHEAFSSAFCTLELKAGIEKHVYHLTARLDVTRNILTYIMTSICPKTPYEIKSSEYTNVSSLGQPYLSEFISNILV